MTSRLCLWELDKLPKPKAKYMASKKKIFSLTGHAISSISTSYQVKFRVRKFVPPANPPHNQYHLLSGRFISGIECIVQLSWHHWTVPNQCCFWSRNIFHQTWCALFSVTLCQSLEFCSALSYFTGTMLNYHNIAYMIDFSMLVKLNYNISMSSMTDMSYLCK